MESAILGAVMFTAILAVGRKIVPGKANMSDALAVLLGIAISAWLFGLFR